MAAEEKDVNVNEFAQRFQLVNSLEILISFAEQKGVYGVCQIGATVQQILNNSFAMQSFVYMADL